MYLCRRCMHGRHRRTGRTRGQRRPVRSVTEPGAARVRKVSIGSQFPGAGAPCRAQLSADVCSGGVGGGSSASQFSTCHGDAAVACDMTNERGAGAAAAGLALATLGLIAVAAGSALIVQETRRNSRDEERRRRRAPHRLRRTALSISECDNYRFRPAPRVPVLHRQPVQMPVGDMSPLSSEILASIVAYLSMRDCVVLCRVNHTWNVAMTSLLRYAPFIKQCVHRGDLQPCRFHAWMYLIGAADARSSEIAHMYCQLMAIDQDPPEVADHCMRIRRDIFRTMPDEVTFTSQPAAPDALYRLLRCYAIMDPQVGYCQGMNYLAAFLLSITNETRAFVLLDIVMRDYGYRWMYVHGLPHLCLCLWQLDHLIAMNLPELHMHFSNEGVKMELYASEWFISLFTYTLSIEDAGRVWDLFILRGWKQIFRVALGALANAAPYLTVMEFEQIVQEIKKRPASSLFGSIDDILARGMSFKVTDTLLRSLEDQFWASDQLDINNA
ncbi:hypothetical protein PBRA_009544 [Plasmodiophora brassicae]|nr:hypothetical protein PBRA_009544 [Plasmodiophora brassicae]